MKNIYLKILLVTSILYFFISGLSAQTTPPVQWQKALGGTGDDILKSAAYNTDGTAILCGKTKSVDGDVTGNHGDADGWVTKLDGAGNILWKKAYGGSQFDELLSIKSTSDNGYIMAGTAKSVDGDVSGNHGTYDGWVLKTDNSGNIQWKKCIGGTKDDEFDVVQPTKDGGYILAGYSASNDGDLNNNKGGNDGWIVKLDASGNIKWRKNYGGSKDDYINDIIQADDGSYIFCGSTESSNGNLDASYGLSDAWVGKVNATNGAIIWSYHYGGSGYDGINSISIATDSSGLILGADSTSSNDYNVTGNHGYYDAWIISFDETNGILTKSSCFGGTGYDAANSIKTTFDKGYIIAGTTQSNDGDVSYNTELGYGQVWVLKLNNSRAIDWARYMVVQSRMMELSHLKTLMADILWLEMLQVMVEMLAVIMARVMNFMQLTTIGL